MHHLSFTSAFVIVMLLASAWKRFQWCEQLQFIIQRWTSSSKQQCCLCTTLGEMISNHLPYFLANCDTLSVLKSRLDNTVVRSAFPCLLQSSNPLPDAH